MESRLDTIDREIVSQLQEDGRRPYTHIARTVGLSEAAVRQRVQRLIDSGVVQVVAVTDPLSLGYVRQAMIQMKVDGDVRVVAQRVGEIDAVIYVIITAGAMDLMCEVVAESDEELLHLVNDQIRGIPGVRSTETTIYLSCEKQTYRWGTR